jgi:hypothetical protein
VAEIQERRRRACTEWFSVCVSMTLCSAERGPITSCAGPLS